MAAASPGSELHVAMAQCYHGDSISGKNGRLSDENFFFVQYRVSLDLFWLPKNQRPVYPTASADTGSQKGCYF